MFVPAQSVVMEPLLQDVIQADAAHIHFGKYMLYSAFGSTTNTTMYPIAFAFGGGMKLLKDGISFGSLQLPLILS